jgi:glycosyltransferase involved in cell wall biosynthesis
MKCPQTIFALVMTKNEQDVIERTIASLVGKVDEIFLYDTGSQDDTIRVAVECAARGSTPIQTTRGPWVDFATSRNEAIAFVETSRPGDDVWILLVDANDVVDDDGSRDVDGC